jgi:hypothetical protein
MGHPRCGPPARPTVNAITVNFSKGFSVSCFRRNEQDGLFAAYFLVAASTSSYNSGRRIAASAESPNRADS